MFILSYSAKVNVGDNLSVARDKHAIAHIVVYVPALVLNDSESDEFSIIHDELAVVHNFRNLCYCSML